MIRSCSSGVVKVREANPTSVKKALSRSRSWMSVSGPFMRSIELPVKRSG